MNILTKLKDAADREVFFYVGVFIARDILIKILIPVGLSGISFTALTLGLFGIKLTDAIQMVNPYVKGVYLGAYAGIAYITFLLWGICYLFLEFYQEEEETDHEDHSN